MITHIVTHWVKPDQVDRALELFEHNGRVVKGVPGLVHRQILRSTTEPLRFTAINTWESDEAFQKWMEHPDHMLDSFGTPLRGRLAPTTSRSTRMQATSTPTPPNPTATRSSPTRRLFTGCFQNR